MFVALTYIGKASWYDRKEARNGIKHKQYITKLSHLAQMICSE